jgi:hypothetical protein
MSVTSNYVYNTDNATVEHIFPSSRAVCTSPPLLHEAVTNKQKWRLPHKDSLLLIQHSYFVKLHNCCNLCMVFTNDR